MPRTSPPTERVVATIALLAERPDASLSLAELTRRLGVNKSTGHAILTSLVAAGWVLRDPTSKTYRLGPAMVALGRQAGASFPALDFARPALVDLSREFAATCAALGVGDDAVTVLDQVADPRAAAHAFRVGASFPLRPPLGAAVVAWASEAVRDDWLGHVPAETRGHYADALAATHDRGFAVEIAATPVARVRELAGMLGDDPSARAALDRLADELATHEEFLAVELDARREYAVNVVNAPVFDHTGHVTLVLSLTGFARALPGAEVLAAGNALLLATRRITDALTPTSPTRARTSRS
ncbi:MAG TPA: helix-turn-helix domain-containing protein [Acidimicrobiia bacterium]